MFPTRTTTLGSVFPFALSNGPRPGCEPAHKIHARARTGEAASGPWRPAGRGGGVAVSYQLPVGQLEGEPGHFSGHL